MNRKLTIVQAFKSGEPLYIQYGIRFGGDLQKKKIVHARMNYIEH